MAFQDKIYYLLKMADLFPANKFLRYQKQTQYKTIFGGSVSLVIIVVMITLFINMGLQTISKSIITSAISSSINVIPSPTDFINGVDGGYGYGFYMIGVNFSDTSKKIFDVTLTQATYSPILERINSISIPLVKCTPQHFSFTSETLAAYYRAIPDWMLCPFIGAQFHIEGSSTANIYTRLQFNITRCNPSSNINCMSDSQAMSLQQANGGYFLYGQMAFNSIINPNDDIYKTYYLDDTNYYYLDLNATTYEQATTQLQQNIIITDVSLLPYENNFQEKALTNSQKIFLRRLPRKNNLCAHLILEKSKKIIKYTRSFNKLDNFFSYVGGFVGVILLWFFILNSYAQTVFTYCIAQDLFDHPSKKDAEKSYNFLYFLSVKIKGILQLFNYSKQWKNTDYFNKRMEEAQEHLDISLILRRLFYLQEVISILLKSPYLETLYLSKKIGIKAAKERRLKCVFLNKFKDKERHQTQNTRNRQFQGNNSQIMLDENQNVENHQNKDDESINTEYLRQRMKTNIIKVIESSRKGQKNSHNIINKIDHNIMKQFGLDESGQNGQIKHIQQAKSKQYKPQQIRYKETFLFKQNEDSHNNIQKQI